MLTTEQKNEIIARVAVLSKKADIHMPTVSFYEKGLVSGKAWCGGIYEL